MRLRAWKSTQTGFSVGQDHVVRNVRDHVGDKNMFWYISAMRATLRPMTHCTRCIGSITSTFLMERIQGSPKPNSQNPETHPNSADQTLEAIRTFLRSSRMHFQRGRGRCMPAAATSILLFTRVKLSRRICMAAALDCVRSVAWALAGAETCELLLVHLLGE